MKNIPLEKGRKMFELLRQDAQLSIVNGEEQAFVVKVQIWKKPLRMAPNDDIRRCRTPDRRSGAYRY